MITFQIITKLIAIHLSKKTELENPDLKRQKLGNIIAKTERGQKAKMRAKKQEIDIKTCQKKKTKQKQNIKEKDIT